MSTTAHMVQIDAVTATAAQVVRELLGGTDGADLCAGAGLDVDTLDRIAASVHALAGRLNDRLVRARAADRYGPFYAYTFDVVDASGYVVSAVTVRKRGDGHGERLRTAAANLLIENAELYGEGVRLSHEAPRVTPSPE